MADPRPTKLSHENVPELVRQVRETEDVFRLYRHEWVSMYVTTRAPHDTSEEDLIARCERVFKGQYEGRVRYEDVHYTVTNATMPHATAALEIRMPVMKGEFKYRQLAEDYAEQQGWDGYTIVARNSKDDHAMRSYGVVKLG